MMPPNADPTSSAPRPDPEPPWASAAGALACALIGVIISAWPYLASRGAEGGPSWVADNDELYYIGVAATGVRDGTGPGDPARDDGARAPYPRLPLWPGIALARLTGQGPWVVPVFWRILGGALVGAAAFGMFRAWLGSARWALPMALLLTVDGGMLSFRPVVQAAVTALSTLEGAGSDLFASKPLIHPEWRIATPCLTGGILLLHLWAMARGREGKKGWRGPATWLAGLTLGLLFWSYFYYWTAALLALAIAWAFDEGHRAFYVRAGLIGLAVGLPSVAIDAWFHQANPDDWLARTDKFIHVNPWSGVHWSRPSLAMAALGMAAVLGGAGMFAYPWALGVAGMLLVNHQVFTGLQIENFHWTYVAGPALAAMTLGLVGSWLSRIGRQGVRRWALGVLAFAAPVLVGVNLWLRHAEVTMTAEPRQILREIAAYRHDAVRWRGEDANGGQSPSSAGPIAPGACLAGEEAAVIAACIDDGFRPLGTYWIWLSPAVTESDWHDRLGLNGALAGRTEAEFLAEQFRNLTNGFAGDWRDDPDRLKAILATRRAAFARHAADPAPGVARYRVRYTLRRAGEGPPPGAPGAWDRVREGETWDLWEATALRPEGCQGPT